LLNTPNKITTKDFDGWVQERGLYYPNKWDANFEPLLSMNDKGENAKDGSLLVAKYGEGYYVYTGLSFFRELPEGVVGAYKLFANLVSAGKGNKKPENAKVRNKAK
ncbi:MAG TPA: LmbE family protein, partial [Chryseolinea sp.]|nr:LmbE family protein [Chryseolinea sp.]